MSKFDWWQHQQDCEDAFWLDCSEEDIKNDKEAKKIFHQFQKQRKYTEMMDRLYQNIMGYNKGFLSSILCAYGIKY